MGSESGSISFPLSIAICAHDRVLTRHNGHFALALLQSLLKTLCQKRSDFGKIGRHNGSCDDFCVTDRVDDLLGLFDIGISDYVIDDLLLIIVVDEEKRILVLFVYDVNKRIDNVSKNNFESAVVKKLSDETSSDLTCAEMYCFFHSLFSFPVFSLQARPAAAPALHINS